MLQYITFNPSWKKLAVDDRVIFHTPDKSFEYFIKLSLQGHYYCYLKNGLNSTIFNILGIDAEKFVSNVVNYPCKGGWPEAKTLDDLKKVIKALDNECIKKWGIQHNSTEPNNNTYQFKVGDKVKILPRYDCVTNYYPTYTDTMQKYVGQLATITNVYKLSCQIDLDDSSYYWPLNALQLVTSEIGETVDPHKLKNGDYIKITSHLLKNLSLIYIFKEIKNKSIYRHVSYNIESKAIDVNSKIRWLFGNDTEITYATEEEKMLLDDALLKKGYRWNNLTKQLDSIIVETRTNILEDINSKLADSLSLKDCIKHRLYTDTTDCTEEEKQTETELNLFPKKKHYQLNFNY